MCVPWELNPRPFVLLTQCSTTEPQEHLLLLDRNNRNKNYWYMSKKGKLNLAVSKIVCLVIYLVAVWIMKYPLACSCVWELFSVPWGYERCESSRCSRSKWEYFQSSEAPEQRSGAPLAFLYSHHVDILLILIPRKVYCDAFTDCLFWFLVAFFCFLPHSLALSVFLRLVPLSSGSWTSGWASRCNCPVWVLCGWLANSKYLLGEGPGTPTFTHRTSKTIQVNDLGMSFGMYCMIPVLTNDSHTTLFAQSKSTASPTWDHFGVLKKVSTIIRKNKDIIIHTHITVQMFWVG